MPNLNTFSMIHEKVKQYHKDCEASSLEESFEWFFLDNIIGLTDEDIKDSLTDGKNDGGIDAIYINERNIHVFTFKYTKKFDNSTNAFPENDLNKLCLTIKRIVFKKCERKDYNYALWDKIVEIWHLFKEGHVNFKFYVCSNKCNPNKRAINKFERDLYELQHTEHFYFDQDKIAQQLVEGRYSKCNGKIKFVDKNHFSRTDGALNGIVATVEASDLVELVADKEDNTKINEDVFNDNVRVYLKLNNPINKSIYDTALSDDNYEFWYRNNGINIVCESCKYNPVRSPVVELQNFQIVNGGQTIHVLFEAYQKDPNKIKDVLLLVKICESNEEDISSKISMSTNTQNKITSRDLKANDAVQRRLEIEFEAKGYYYERKKKMYIDKPKNKRLNNELLGQLYMAYYLNRASEAKNKKRLIFGDYYDEIFKDDVTTDKFLTPYSIYLPLAKIKNEIKQKKRKNEKNK